MFIALYGLNLEIKLKIINNHEEGVQFSFELNSVLSLIIYG